MNNNTHEVTEQTIEKMAEDSQQLNIALLGAPGSGKTAVARKTVSLIKRSGGELGEWGVVDAYVDAISRNTGIPLSVSANFPQNLSIVTARWVKEAELYHKGMSVITCGSIYESILYATLPFMLKAPEDMNPGENIFNQVMMQALGALEKTTYHYDAMFFLPFNPKMLAKNEHTWGGVINAKIPEVLEGFGKQVIVLDQKTVDAKASVVVESISKIREFYAKIIAANVEPGV